MKILIASDIHGSALFCSMLVGRFNAEKADRILLLGDILYHGPRNDLPPGYAPKECIAMLNAVSDRIVCVRGNCDAEVDQTVLDFNISDDFILHENGVDIFVTHGHHINCDSLPADFGYGALLYGHTHIPLNAKRNNVICINPGSVSIPKENSPHSYMTFDRRCFLWKTLGGVIYDGLDINS